MIGERRDDEVAERVAGEALALGEAVLEERPEKPGVLVGQRDEAVADVARRQHAELLAQLAARSSVVGHRDDGARLETEVHEAAEHRGKAGAAADGDRTTTRAHAHRCSRSRPMSRWLTATR